MNRALRHAGFTFVEILAAMVFLAILMPAVLGALSLSSRASLTAERRAIACQLAENQLQTVLLDGSWNTGSTRGSFDTGYQDYRWELTRADWAADAMQELTMTVSFNVQGQEQSVRLTTLTSEALATP